LDNTGAGKTNNSEVGKAEAEGIKVDGIIEETDDANIWKLGWTSSWCIRGCINLDMGAVIWNPGTLYDGTTLVSVFI